MLAGVWPCGLKWSHLPWRISSIMLGAARPDRTGYVVGLGHSNVTHSSVEKVWIAGLNGPMISSEAPDGAVQMLQQSREQLVRWVPTVDACGAREGKLEGKKTTRTRAQPSLRKVVVHLLCVVK